MQLSDSALPIGTLSHSFGLEMLVEDGSVTVNRLYSFLTDYLQETGTVEAAYCLKMLHTATRYRANDDNALDDALYTIWLTINGTLDALKQARESREASTALGRRLLQLVLKLEPNPIIERAVQVAKAQQIGTHHSAAFGLTCGLWQIDPQTAAAAFLQQTITSLVSACQRLMPLGQTQANQLLWDLKPAILVAAANGFELAAILDDRPPAMFAVSLEVASMRHPDMITRLFIS
jgi:urease accessory protein